MMLPTITAKASKKYSTTITYTMQRLEITTNGTDEDEDVLPKFLPFDRKYVFVGAVWRHNAPQ